MVVLGYAPKIVGFISISLQNHKQEGTLKNTRADVTGVGPLGNHLDWA